MHDIAIKSNGSAASTHVAIDGVEVRGLKALHLETGIPADGHDGLMHVTLTMVARVTVDSTDTDVAVEAA